MSDLSFGSELITALNGIRIHIGSGQRGESFITGRYANRHGLIAGATGTGKTVTIETLALGFSQIGIPVFLADVKGDIASALGRTAASVRHLDPFGREGKKFSISVSRMGPELLSRTLELSDVQAGVLEVLFEREANRLPTSLSDLRSSLQALSAHRAAVSRKYGLVSAASIAAIQRAVLRAQREGGDHLFQAPTFDAATLEQRLEAGGLVSILHASRLMRSPQLYAASLLFILQDMYDRLPEVGDSPVPRLVLFLDEAHLLFEDCPPALLSRIERIVRLIRSKAVALFFATQSPADIPPVILGQLGNRIQHGLRGATPQDQRAIRAAAETLPASTTINAAAEIGRLGVGHALVSTIGRDGVPIPVDLVRVKAPVLSEVVQKNAGTDGSGPAGSDASERSADFESAALADDDIGWPQVVLVLVLTLFAALTLVCFWVASLQA